VKDVEKATEEGTYRVVLEYCKVVILNYGIVSKETTRPQILIGKDTVTS